jgi:hypothetical protein
VEDLIQKQVERPFLKRDEDERKMMGCDASLTDSVGLFKERAGMGAERVYIVIEYIYTFGFRHQPIVILTGHTALSPPRKIGHHPAGSGPPGRVLQRRETTYRGMSTLYVLKRETSTLSSCAFGGRGGREERKGRQHGARSDCLHTSNGVYEES